MVTRFRRRTSRKPGPSSSANAVESTGKTASENATPIRLTGSTW